MARFEAQRAKSKRYARELKRRRRRNGKKLTRSTASYRLGYLRALRERSKAYRARKTY